MKRHQIMALLAGVSAFAVGAAHAQTAPAAGQVDEVVVTGSRVITNGNNSPSPVTVVSAQDLQTSRPTTVFESLLDLPAFAGSRGTVAAPAGSAGGGSNGQISALNLRGLGPVRTLILFDGHRVPPTQQDGLVNSNTIPQMLLQRVDIVTGGASAVYGSDAIGGVVNFVTDRKFNGVKLEAQRGVSHHGDAPSYQFGVAGGMNLFDGRGHIEGSLQNIHDAGIPHRTDRPGRFGPRWSIQGNGTTATPYFLAANATNSSFTWGGKITGPATNPLRNFQFSSNGVLTPFQNGSTTGLPAGSIIQIGGDGAYDTGSSIKSRSDIQQAFGRFDFDVTDKLHFFASVSATHDKVFNYFGNANIQNVTISATNAFLSPAYQQQMTAAGLTTFTFSKKYSEDSAAPLASNLFDTQSLYINTGLEGSFGDYKWEASYTRSDVELEAQGLFTFNNGRVYAALDAVRDPATGNIVCNVTLTNPGLYPGCVPINVFGPTSESTAAIDYARQKGNFLSKMPTDDLSGSITGSPFSTWAGEVNVALSGGWRKQGFELESTNPPVNYAPLDCTGLRFNCTRPTATNVGTPTFNGATSPRPAVNMTVAEAAVEGDFPLLVDQPLAQSLNLNLAYRYAKYEAEGSPDIGKPNQTYEFKANTWKVGLDWHINDIATVRATRSRDIRAPNLFELFQPNSVTYTNSFTDLLTGRNVTASGAFPAIVNGGNPTLQPEVASTTTLGLVIKPTSQFSLAIDAFDIKVDDFISRLVGSDAPVQNACYAGNAFYCALQVRPGPLTDRTAANAVTQWSTVPVNIAQLKTRGVDVEANFATTLLDRALSLRGLATYQPHVRFIQPGAATVDYAGAYGTPSGSGAAGPKLRISVFARYAVTDKLTIDWMTRWRDEMHLAPDPTLVASPNTDAKAVAFSSLNLTYKLPELLGGQSSLFLNIQNVFDKQGPIAASYSNSGQPGLFGGFVPGDDPIGRYYSLGIRARW